MNNFGEMMKRKHIAILLLFVLAAGFGGCKKEKTEEPVATITALETTPTGGTVATTTVPLNEADRKFILDAATFILGEVAYASTADSLATTVKVKAFAHLLKLDHTAMLGELRRFADDHDVVLPEQATAAIVADGETLSKLKGGEFDRVFLQHVIDDHNAVILLFDAEAAVVQDDDLREWVAKIRPKLQAHVAQAQELKAEVNP
jgi:putative membrane protein